MDSRTKSQIPSVGPMLERTEVSAVSHMATAGENLPQLAVAGLVVGGSSPPAAGALKKLWHFDGATRSQSRRRVAGLAREPAVNSV